MHQKLHIFSMQIFPYRFRNCIPSSVYACVKDNVKNLLLHEQNH